MSTRIKKGNALHIHFTTTNEAYKKMNEVIEKFRKPGDYKKETILRIFLAAEQAMKYPHMNEFESVEREVERTFCNQGVCRQRGSAAKNTIIEKSERFFGSMSDDDLAALLDIPSCTFGRYVSAINKELGPALEMYADR